MNIALVIASLGTGGAERVMSELANHLAERGDRVTLITLDTADLDAYPLAPAVERVALGIVRDSTGIVDALATNWRRLRVMRRAIRDTGARTVLSFEERTNVLVVVATLGLGIRRVVSERTDPMHHEIGPVWTILRRLTYPLADAVVVQTARLLPWARRAALRSRAAHAIPNPLRTLKGATRSARAREPMIAALGRLWPEKGYDVLIKAFARIAPEYPAWRLTIVGEGPEREALTALAASLGVVDRIAMPGWTDVPEEVLGRAAVFVMSSRYEGFPNALLEAMGAGLPVISTACGGTEEMIEEGRNGYVVPIDDAAALAAALRRLLGDPDLRECLAAGARAAALRYSPGNVVPMWDAVLKASRAPASGVPNAAPRIVFLTRRLDVGGAQRQLVELALGLHAAGWRVVVATFYEGGALAAPLQAAGVRTVALGKSGRWDIFAFALRLARLLRRERADIVHGYLATSNVLLALLRPFLGPTRVVWGVRASDMDLTHYDRMAAIEARLARGLAGYADLVICNSEAGRSHHIDEGYPAERMVVIPNGIDVQRFAPNVDARRALRAEWGIAADDVLLGLVARLDPMKDHRNFLAAAARVAGTHDRARFVCVGDGAPDYRAALQAEASRLGLAGRLLWAGARADMPAVYNALDVAVSSSSYGEGFSNAIAEAMATGVACVVTDVGDSASIVGPLGWVVPPRDSAALADALAAAIAALPGDSKGRRERVTGAYSSANLLERTIGTLAPMLGGRSPLVRASMRGTNEF